MALKVVNSNTQMGASGPNHASGDVPDPGASAGTTKFLREDATWDVPSSSGGVTSLNSETGALTIGSSGGTIDVTEPSGTTINLEVDSSHVVTSLNSETGAVSLVAGSGITVTPAGSNITIAATGGGSGVSSLNSLTGALSLTSTGSTVTITPSGSTIDLEVSGGSGPLKGSCVVSSVNSVGFYTATATVTGATTSMTAIAALPPSGVMLAISLVAVVTGTNTVEVGLWNFVSSITYNPTIEVLVFP